ncbi:hypothetical protein T552_04116 [Pneumocystis carinii B80]|uniref:Alpha-1,3/1,6-mannosyltransferase ALG2 n=1 Tax=Pneumocystis carinii (strain B80) TaxID=1408658 RepID=A0A0W4ZKB8_PNEC8|nr:hypothetical protein T552_04116 [Pneumocystis carinii B80]KTW28823.1 hypothetical protein T552_04116 [Pneumocystis carinii B80]
MKIAFIHPDLGIGGAERFTVDAAIGLQQLGHNVIIYTNHCDRSHCFEEIKKGILGVNVYGDKIPRKIFGKLSVFCAIIRQLYLSLRLFFKIEKYDVIIMDVLPISIPLLRWKCLKIVFYCHFPDQLLAKRSNMLRRIYRIPFDNIEKMTILMADKVLVNSYYTESVVRRTFLYMKDLSVLYPSINISEKENGVEKPLLVIKRYKGNSHLHYILSINRFERKKNIDLAIKAYSQLKKDSNFNKCCLIIAGGYESRIKENVEYHNELVELCNNFSFISKTFMKPYEFPLDFSGYNVVFLLSIPTDLKNHLLQNATILLYTPPYEHFGIVPLEAMFHETIVLAQDNGGPLETIDNGVTGWLKKSNENEWAKVLRNVLFEMNDNQRIQMGKRCKQKVISCFSREKMAKTLELHIKTTKRYYKYDFIYLSIIFFILIFSIYFLKNGIEFLGINRVASSL